MATVGVLCARVRVEEKQIMAALAEAGVVPTPLAPADVPLPVGPSPRTPTGPGAISTPATDLIVDRCQDRATAAVILRVARAVGVDTLDAGLAATGDRLAVAAALGAARLPRPETKLAIGEAAVVDAVAAFGYPSTLLPLPLDGAGIVLPDLDTAEAVAEHRLMLGPPGAAIVLVQAGVAAVEARWTVIVVGGRALAATTATGGLPLPGDGARLAEAAAAVLGADLIGIEVADSAGGLVVWDAHPLPDFRHAVAFGSETVAEAIATRVFDRCRRARITPVDEPWQPSNAPDSAPMTGEQPDWIAAEASRGEVRDGVAILA